MAGNAHPKQDPSFMLLRIEKYLGSKRVGAKWVESVADEDLSWPGVASCGQLRPTVAIHRQMHLLQWTGCSSGRTDRNKCRGRRTAFASANVRELGTGYWENVPAAVPMHEAHETHAKARNIQCRRDSGSGPQKKRPGRPWASSGQYTHVEACRSPVLVCTSRQTESHVQLDPLITVQVHHKCSVRPVGISSVAKICVVLRAVALYVAVGGYADLPCWHGHAGARCRVTKHPRSRRPQSGNSHATVREQSGNSQGTARQ
jgi:hypothetical protein